MAEKHRYRIEVERAGDCGYDYESFIDGFYCLSPSGFVIIEDADFHFAHLCADHATKVMTLLARMGLVETR